MQEFVVGVAVALALAFVVWRFMPARWRRAIASRAGLRGAPSGGGCHGCDSCAACGPKAPDIRAE